MMQKEKTFCLLRYYGELQQLLLNRWMISKAEDNSTVGSGV